MCYSRVDMFRHYYNFFHRDDMDTDQEEHTVHYEVLGLLDKHSHLRTIFLSMANGGYCRF